MKACIFKFGFEDYMRIKRTSETKEMLEFERKDAQGRDPTMHHYPLKELILPALEFVEDEVKKLKLNEDLGEENLQMRKAIHEMMEPVKVLKDFVLFVDARPKNEEEPEPREEIWKYSLGLPTSDKKLLERLNELKRALDEGIMNRFFEASLTFLFTKFGELYRKLERAHNLLARNKLQAKVEEIFEKLGLPMTLYHKILKKDVASYQEIIYSILETRNPWGLFAQLMDPEGIPHDVEKMKYNTRVAKINNKRMMYGRFRNNINWMSYIVAVSFILIFTYPHESIGRYQRTISGKNTDQLYLENRTKVRILVDQSCMACDNIRIILKMNQ